MYKRETNESASEKAQCDTTRVSVQDILNISPGYIYNIYTLNSGRKIQLKPESPFSERQGF